MKNTAQPLKIVQQRFSRILDEKILNAMVSPEARPLCTPILPPLPQGLVPAPECLPPVSASDNLVCTRRQLPEMRLQADGEQFVPNPPIGGLWLKVHSHLD